MKARDLLFAYKDEKYADFQAKLLPTISRDSIIGVRLPDVRKICKIYKEDEDSKLFLEKLPHRYFDENMLHGFLIAEIKDFDECVRQIEKFLPYVDNWAVCDSTNPKVFAKHKAELLERVKVWIKSESEFTARFGLETLQRHFLDKDFNVEYLEYTLDLKCDAYYVKMMHAWLFATALAKQWDCTIPFIENRRLKKWVHDKAIQKAIESFRISDERKEYLRSLKV